jgi:DNA-binding LacI/PurR family transcriptional regulator
VSTTVIASVSAAAPASARVTMLDVARVAGVSHMTVSRVFNGRQSVRPTTRARVLTAVRELGYSQNVAARTLSTGRSRTVGVVTLTDALYGPTSTLYGAESAARAAGYFVVMVGIGSAEPTSVAAAISSLVDQGVDGIAVIAPSPSLLTVTDVARGIPLVVFEAERITDVGGVSADNVFGSHAATTHLLDLGHATVWHVAGPADSSDARGRIAGWQDALIAAGSGIPPILQGDWTAKSGYAAGRIIARVPDATAVFAANDDMALGLLLALRDSGREVPRDVSVVGFDDIPNAAYFAPPLTTVRQDFGDVGRRGLHLLVDQIEARVATRDPCSIASRLVVRHSTAPPAVNGAGQSGLTHFLMPTGARHPGVLRSAR